MEGKTRTVRLMEQACLFAERKEIMMTQKVLVAYATKHGSTAEISEKIGMTLEEAGLKVEVMSVDDVADLEGHTAVILGSAVYIGRWRKEAAKFLEANEQELATRDVWLFSSGPTGEGDPVENLQGWRLPESLQPVAERIQPHEIAVFPGALMPEDLNFLEKWAIKNVKAPIGDFRDWEMITAWAESIAKTLKATETT